MFNLFVASVVPFLISGPFVPDLIVSSSSLIFLFHVFRNKKYYYFNKKPLIIFFLFCAYCISISFFVAENKFLSFESSLFYFRIGVFACLIWYLIDQDKQILKYFYYLLVICFSILIFYGYIQYLTANYFTENSQNISRISSFFGDELILGSYLSRLFPLLFALFVIKNKNKLEKYYVAFLFISIDILIFISGERSAFLYLNLSTFFIIILIKNYQRFRIVTFIIAFIFISILTLTNNNVKDRMITQTSKSMGLIKESKKKYIFTPQHDSLIRTAYNMFESKPFFGHGPKMFREICKKEEFATGISPCSTHPHNFYIQLLAETGIFGFMFLFSMFIYVLFCTFKQIESIVLKKNRYLSDYQVCLLAGILITVWPFSPNGNFFNNWLSICYSLPMGFYLHSIYSKNSIENL